MLSRCRLDSSWALLHPLWTPGNELEKTITIAKLRKALKPDPDLLQEELKFIEFEKNTLDRLAMLPLPRDLKTYIGL